MFSTKEYWENRLQKNFTLQGVGYFGLGINYNNALYEVRKFVFHKVMKSLNIDFHSKNVMDIGSGTGFYIDRWKELNVKSITGTDIAEVAVKNLSKKYPGLIFKQLDIGDELNEIKPSYDIISAFDVLFHLVEDERFERAIKNIHGLLHKNGYFIISDNFVHGTTIRSEYQVMRSYEYMTNVIEKTGFLHIKTKPMFVLMYAPVDSNNQILKRWFWFITRCVQKSEKNGKILGNLLIPIEKLLVSIKTEGPSSEIKVFQKI